MNEVATSEQWVVEVYRFDNGEVVQRIGPYKTERQADKVDDGINVNLNHDAYYTLVLPTRAEAGAGDGGEG